MHYKYRHALTQHKRRVLRIAPALWAQHETLGGLSSSHRDGTKRDGTGWDRGPACMDNNHIHRETHNANHKDADHCSIHHTSTIPPNRDGSPLLTTYTRSTNEQGLFLHLALKRRRSYPLSILEQLPFKKLNEGSYVQQWFLLNKRPNVRNFTVSQKSNIGVLFFWSEDCNIEKYFIYCDFCCLVLCWNEFWS